MLGKKADTEGEMLFILFLAIFILIGSATMIYVLYDKGQDYSKPIGELQIGVLESNYEADKAQFFLGQSADYAAKNTIIKLAESGGFFSTDHESYLGFAVWSQSSFPDPEDDFKDMLNSYLESYTSAYPSLPKSDYDLQISYNDDNIKINGQSKEGMRINILAGTTVSITEKSADEEEQQHGAYIQEGGFGYIWPLDTDNPLRLHVTSCIGERDYAPSPYTEGIDIDGNTGDSIISIADGTVIASSRANNKIKNFGDSLNRVIIDHNNGYISHYLHNSEIKVSIGDEVKQGDVIALLGDKGSPGSTHLDMRITKEGRWIDPLSLYDLEKISAQFWKQSNCYYWADKNNYPYKEYVKQNVFG